MALTQLQTTQAQRLKQAIRDVPDFPKPGILFKDITPIFQDPVLLKLTIDLFEEALVGQTVDAIAGIESRGFLFGVPLALQLGVSFVPIRKRGKLPAQVVQQHYDLEYGTDCIEMHADAVQPGARVVLIDDLLATGGTAAASAKLIEQVGAKLVSSLFLIELTFLNGRDKFPYDSISLIQY